MRLFSGGPTYHATDTEDAGIRFSDDDRMLVCRGVDVGTVAGLGATCHESEQEDEEAHAIIQPVQAGNAYANHECLRDAIWRTLVGNRTPKGRVAPTTYRCLLDCTLPGAARKDADADVAKWRGRDTFNRLMQRNRHFQVGNTTLGEVFPTGQLSKPDPDDAEDALERMFRFWRWRRLLITVEGKLGAGPPAMRPGDKIFVVLGSKVPLVLRPAEMGFYQLIGCCYLHGTMDGEAMRHAKQKDSRLEDVTIC
jgi:hypothetical protein